MTDKVSALMGLPERELEVIRSIARTPWYSIWVKGPYKKLRPTTIRVPTVVIRADRLVLIGSLSMDVSPMQEAFRLFISVGNGSEPAVKDSELLLIAGGREALLEHFGLLPRPKQMHIVWNRLQYAVGKVEDLLDKDVTVPSGLVLDGEYGRLLICQDEVPMWLRLEWDSKTLEQTLRDAQRVEPI